VSTPHKPILRRITLKNFLSFGPERVSLELENLNILIGPNASGKSNLIEAIALLRATPVSRSVSDWDLQGILRREL
jgi:AAA15 family ATPase/GTPase